MKFQGRCFFIDQGQGDRITQETRLWEEGTLVVVTSCFYSSDVVETSTRFMVHLVILCLLYVPLTCVILFRKQLQ